MECLGAGYNSMARLRDDDPNIIGGQRTIWTAAIVLGCILLYGLAILSVLLSPSSEASAGSLVGASCFLLAKG